MLTWNSESYGQIMIIGETHIFELKTFRQYIYIYYICTYQILTKDMTLWCMKIPHEIAAKKKTAIFSSLHSICRTNFFVRKLRGQQKKNK